MMNDLIGTLRLKAIAVSCLMVALVACAGASEPPEPVTNPDGFQVTKLPNCGTERRGEFSLYREAPVINEGNGYVGFVTEEQNATGVNTQRYSLVNCATRTIVRVESKVGVAGSSDVSETLFDRVDSLRRSSRLANEAIFEDAVSDRGYSVITGPLPAIGDDRAERVDCGCRRFYRETVRTN